GLRGGAVEGDRGRLRDLGGPARRGPARVAGGRHRRRRPRSGRRGLPGGRPGPVLPARGRRHRHQLPAEPVLRGPEPAEGRDDDPRERHDGARPARCGPAGHDDRGQHQSRSRQWLRGADAPAVAARPLLMDTRLQQVLRKTYEALPAVLVLVASVVAWEIVIVAFGVKEVLVPAPSKIVRQLGNPSLHWLYHFWVTAREALGAFP